MDENFNNKNNIRNFVIIAHIDHGKSTLADRFLEMTGAVHKDKMKEQFLDSMNLEREKGITIKMHPVRLTWRPNQTEIQSTKSEILNKSKIQNLKSKTNSLEFRISNLGFANSGYILNLIDTPGHIDFSYEISRALACCEGALLLVDAVKGIQAQTLYNLSQAQKQGLTIVGAVNKIDLPQARVKETQEELAEILNLSPEEVFTISGKTGENVEALLNFLVKKIPPPLVSDTAKPFKALVFDSKYDSFFGVVAYVRVFNGHIAPGDKIYFMQANHQVECKEVGYFMPQLISNICLNSGEIGYIKTGIKIPAKVKVGETITVLKNFPEKNRHLWDIGYSDIKPLPGYKEPQPVLFLSLYPYNADEFDQLRDGLEKLRLNDPSLNFTTESKILLGCGFRLGFLGSLHAEITIRRLKEEFNLDLVATSPQVVFKVVLNNGAEKLISSPSLWPDMTLIKETEEPYCDLEIITPNDYIHYLFPLLKNFSISLQEIKFLTPQKSVLQARAPLREIISGSFYDKIKTVTQGYGSFSFISAGYQKSDLVKMDILIAGEAEDAFAKIVPRNEAYEIGKNFIRKLKDILPSQQFLVALQTSVGGKIVARENISAKRKDVTAPLYGGDVTRKKKLLEIQKKGKKDLQSKGKVRIPANVFLEMLRD
ncbi:elongation factor 4 [bacterium (Candidatus Gribaldobacteria) CG08_land_8_20_14_0_20_39_15]|uniref:Elongation factor 4 n=1 Tax=bacterium (Candidatus Gribaldobacteria) CG08_land_8_20_14_0_20_39_15 TaxID=2014273 RepID=A0A2M6XUU5_9BACT|nr:MAG: elongation factor 4 [bacterium (Candidatus Gribaldobacteria) CG08_land_8_20_14_0_20_39_15]